MLNKIENWDQWNSKTNNFKKYAHIKSELIYGKISNKIPSVSIMILTYKRAEGLKNALDSAIKQNYKKSFEIVVCDDSGYDEDTDKLMKKYCEQHNNIIYYRHKKNIGQYANWNRACELCRTEWYCLLHDDDQLKSNYLSVLTNTVSGNEDFGLIGVYIEVNDMREKKDLPKTSNWKKILYKLINIGVKIGENKIVNLNMKDNLKHIFVMNSTFINKNRAMEIGGLDDNYYPSSDFVFSAKMAFYYKTLFLPKRLTEKGINESESLKLAVCQDSIRCAYNMTYQIAKNLNFSNNKCLEKASIAAVIAEIGVKGYNDVDYGKVKKELGMNAIYNNKFIILIINLYSKINWGMLLFRRSL